MSAVILATPIEVDSRLNEFELRREQLIEIVHAMVAAKAECTENDPPGSRGWSSYRYGTRRAREVFRPDGWLKDDTDQVASIIKPKLGMRIIVANTDDATGRVLEEREPQNRSKKGAATERVIDDTQASLFPPTKSKSKVILFRPSERHSSSYVTYYLCVYCEGDDVRAELSCPVKVENGFFVGFGERILLIGPGGWPPSAKSKRDDAGRATGGHAEFNIPVRRK